MAAAPVKLSPAQANVASSIKTRLEAGVSSVTLGGLAGTGKTTLVGQLPGILEVDYGSVAFCAYTGKAATVINRKLASNHVPAPPATTIHKLIYRAIESHNEDCPRTKSKKAPCGLLDGCGLSYQAKPELPAHVRLVIVDEASMVPESIYAQLLSYGVPVIWVGDHGQLPPVKSAFNLMAHPDLRLEEIHRQARDSAIIRCAMSVRKTGQVPKMGRYNHGEVEIRPGPSMPGFEEQELEDGEMVYLVSTNRLRVALNRNVRQQLGREGHPVPGDRVVCLRNNDEMGVYNGMTGKVVKYTPEAEDPDYASMAVSVDFEDRVYVGRVYARQFLKPRTLQDEVDRREADLWDYGYALTVHKSQGSEYPRVVVVARDLGWVNEPERWLYTACTRAKEKLQIVG